MRGFKIEEAPFGVGPIVCMSHGISGSFLRPVRLIPPCGGTRFGVPDISPVETVFAGTSHGIYGNFLRLARLIPACVRRLAAIPRTAQTGRRQCGRLPVQPQQFEKTLRWVKKKELLRQRWRVHSSTFIILLRSHLEVKCIETEPCPPRPVEFCQSSTELSL